MKKKTLPILLLLAGLSAAALAGCGHEHTYSWKQSEDGETHWQECECGEKTDPTAHVDANSDDKCDDCGFVMHAHAYEWNSDASKHWKECECGDKIEEGTHKDENSDDKCDDCSRDYFAVTFAMHDHGTAPAAQKIVSGGLVKAPDAPADEDAIKFKGWFKDEDFTTAFDFEKDTITAATTIHAKWEEDDTEGASKAHAYELTKDVDCLQPAKNSVTYFKYVAEAAGRYTVSLGIGENSQNATFTTSVTGDAVYGKDHAEEAIFDLEEGATVYIMYTFLGEEGEDITAGICIGDTVDEPLPEDHFLDGEYENEDYTISITVDRDTKKITFFEIEYPFTYVGGSVDSVYFTQSFYGQTTKYVVHYEGDGTYSVTANGQKVATMHLFVAPDPIALSAIEGYYEPKEDATYGITELYIYESESEDTTAVRYNQGGYYYNAHTVEYDTIKNRLTFDDNIVTINLAEDGTVASISVGGNVYERKGDAGVPLPSRINIEESSEYVGTIYEIRDDGFGQYCGDYTVTITGYNKDTGAYTVSISDTTYQLTISADGNTITLCDEAGETTIDTLTKFAYVYHEFPAEGDEVTIADTDFQKGQVYLYTIETAGWYAFTGVSDSVSIHYNVNSYDPLWKGTPVDEDAVYLTAGSIVGVYVEEPEETTFTVATADAPAGWEENNPKALEDGTATINAIIAGNTYYFTYTVGEAGPYLVNAYFDYGESYMSDFIISYSIDGTTYDFEDYSATDAATKITATAGQEIKINVIVDEYLFSKSSITVTVEDGTWLDATDVELTGEAEGNSLNVSAEADSGVIYYLASTKGGEVTVTGTAAFTVKLRNGEPVEATEDDGTFIAVIPAGEDVYFTIVSDTEQTVTLSQTFAEGSQGYPVEISLTEGNGTITATKQDKFFTLPAGNYIFTSESIIVFTNGDAEFTTGAVVTVKEGDVLSCKISLMDYAFTATVTIKEAHEIFTAEQAGTYAAMVGSTNITLTFDKFGGATYSYSYWGSTNAIITAGENGTYTFEYYNDDSWEDATVTFTFVDGNISIIDSQVNGGEAYTLEKQAVGGTYTGYIGNDYDGAAAKLEIDGNVVTYYRDMGEGVLVVMMDHQAFTENVDGTLTFEDRWGTYIITISEDGNSVEFLDGELAWSGTLTKEA